MKLEVSASDYDHGDMAEWGEDTFGMADGRHMVYDDDDEDASGFFDPNYIPPNPVRQVS